MIFSVFGVGSVTAGPWLAHAADRFGRRRIATLACLVLATFPVILVLQPPRPLLYVVTFAAGGGWTAFSAAWFALLSATTPTLRRGQTFGVVSAASTFGTAAGALAASAIWHRAGLHSAVVALSVPILLAGAAVLATPRKRGP